jgi:hypothetical protein
MLPHFMAGMAPEQAARAVLEDDARLVTAAFDRRSSSFFPTPDERGRSQSAAEGKGDVIAAELSRRVHTVFQAAA